MEEGKIYLGWVQGFAPFGVFVQLNDRVKGLVHKTNVKMKHTERDPIIVHVLQVRSNGNIDLEEVTPIVYQTENVIKKMPSVLLGDIGKLENGDDQGRLLIKGDQADYRTIVDESGTADAAAFIGPESVPILRSNSGTLLITGECSATTAPDRGRV